MIALAVILLLGVAALAWAAHRWEILTARLKQLHCRSDDLKAQLAKVDAGAERARMLARYRGMQLAIERRRLRIAEQDRDVALAAGLVHAGVVRRLREENAALTAGHEKLISRVELETLADFDRELRQLEAGS